MTITETKTPVCTDPDDVSTDQEIRLGVTYGVIPAGSSS